MIKRTLFLSMTAFTLLAAPVMAENGQGRGGIPSNAGGGSYNVSAKQLDHVEFYSHPRQFQILDTRPTIRDLRQPERGPENIQFNLSNPGTLPGNTIIYQDNPSAVPAAGFRSGNPMVNAGGLAPANSMFTSNVPAKPIAAAGLPDGSRMGHLGPMSAPQLQSTKALAGRLNPGNPAKTSGPVPVLGYADTHQSGASSSGRTASASLVGRVLPNALIHRLDGGKK